MTHYSDAEVWLIIAIMGVVTFLIRFSFLGLVGDRDMPPWLLRHLRYTAVAVLPGLVAPLVLWPEASGGNPDAARLIAAFATVLIGWWRKSLLWGVVAGAATLGVLSAI